MSEVQSRPVASRGRGSGRGGRAGHSSRGGGRTGARPAATNGDSHHEPDSALPTLEDEGEIKELRAKYGDNLPFVQEIFSDWSAVDILYALRETDGDVDETVSRMFDGTISKWGEVSKPKKTKPKSDTFTTTTADSVPASSQRNTRGGRAIDSGRGGRGRATERGGRGGARGKSAHVTTDGARGKENQPLSVATEESTEWTAPQPSAETTGWSDSSPAETAAAPKAATPTPAPAVPKPSTVQEGGVKTWASMFKQPAAPKPAPPKAKEEPPAPEVTEPAIEPLPAAPAEPETPEPEVPAPVEEKEEPTPEPVEEQPPAPVAAVEPPVIPVVPIMPAVVVPEVTLLPSKDLLTDKNLDRVPDVSHPPETETARSEAADSWDPRNASSTATPLSAAQQQHQADRVPSSGFAATATKATSRAPVFPRRVLDQLEAVRMPGNRDQVDRAAVQFGAFSLNGPVDDDIDGDREEPETRPQPPQDSPVTQPRTSLPPVQPAPAPESFPTPTQKPVTAQVPTGPAAAAPVAAPAPIAPIAANTTTQPPAAPQNQHFGRFGSSQDSSSFSQSKPYDAFPLQAQQPNVSAAQSQFESNFQQAQQPAQAQNQQVGGAFSSAPADYNSSYYTAADQRGYYGAYNHYNQPQGAQGQQDGVSGQGQRSYGGYNATQSDISQYPQSGVQHGQSRFGAASGPAAEATVPAPTQTSGLPQTSQSNQAQSHTQQPPDYNNYSQHPYFNNPYYASYAYQQQHYGQQTGYAGPYGKGGVGYQPNQYAMSQGPQGYSNPSAGFGQPGALHRDAGATAGAAGGLDSYGRAGSQSAPQQSGFGGMHDAFARGGSSYQSQAGQSFNTPGSQPAAGASGVDDLKNFGDVKGAAGPSPSLGVAARPGSAANNGPSQSGLPPPQSSQQSGLGGMGQYGYPSHIQQGHGLHGNQSAAGGYGMGAGAAGQSQQGAYGYNQGGFSSYYGGGGNHARGWGNNYPH
ncbi:hypothetical protein QBC35DRAFT_495486 [Podospora australis]|uniref:CUE domain-containing protein n=1 Tax=Podospora australis TaxID=1536484 RepID=A0AAN7AJX1_9PEZI|nr:hypothetical protein QBC35DRAFT_495486 [Podospora australis]